MAQTFQIGDIVRLKSTGKQYVITMVVRQRYGDIIHEMFEYTASNIPPGTSRRDIPWSFNPDASAYADQLSLETPSPWRQVKVNGQPIPMVDDQTRGPYGDEHPYTVEYVVWTLGTILVNGFVFTEGTIPLTFTTF